MVYKVVLIVLIKLIKNSFYLSMDEIIFILYHVYYLILFFDFYVINLLKDFLSMMINIHVKENLIVSLLWIILFIINLWNKMVVILLLISKAMLLGYKNQHQMNVLIYII